MNGKIALDYLALVFIQNLAFNSENMVHPVFHAFQKQATHYLHWKKLRNFNMEARVPDLVSTNKLSYMYETIFYATAVCFV